MKSFKEFVIESLTKYEIHSTTLEQARKYAESLIPDLDKVLPDFDKHYTIAQKQASKGHTLRKDMPVISADVYDDFEQFAKDKGIKVKRTKIAVKKLLPVQQQIYFDKSMSGIAENGIEGSKRFLNSKIFIISSDFKIIDGHHRYLSALLMDPNIKVPVMIIDKPANKLLPLSLEFSDSIGKVRNV